MEFIKSVNLSLGRDSIELKAGQYKSLFLYFSGTNQAAQTVTLANFGNVRVTRNGHDFVNADLQYLHSYADLKHGLAEYASAVGAAFTLGFHISAEVGRRGEFPNVFQFNDDDQVFLHVDFGAAIGGGAIVASGTCEVYGVPASGIEMYLPQLIQDQMAFTGAGSEKEKATIPNIHSILTFPSTPANFTKLQVMKDGINYQDANYGAGASYTNLVNEKEASAIAAIETMLAIGLRPDELFSEDVYVYPTVSGANTLTFLYIGAKFDNKATINSKAKMNQDIQRNRMKKEIAGKLADLDALAVA